MMQFILLQVIILSTLTCNIENEAKKRIKEDNKFIEIIQDTFFRNGISVHGSTTDQPKAIGYLFPFGENTKTSHWSLSQWGSNNIINGNTPSTKSNDTIIYQNNSKRVYFHAKKDGNNKLGLEVFSSNEYEHPRRLGEDWVHLLFGQDFEDPVFLNNVEYLNYKIKAKLLFCDNKMNEDYNPDLHTAQITFFITVQNKNKESSQYGDFFWFGLPLYDYRYENISEYGAEDLGKEDASKKFILTVASTELFQTSMHTKNWITIDKNIYPLIKSAFKTAQNKGYMKNSSWSDLCISSMNIGWEVPGTFDCGVLFETPSLVAVMK